VGVAGHGRERDGDGRDQHGGGRDQDDGERDQMDVILEQWRRERPDLDLSPIGVFGRIAQLTGLLGPPVEAVLARHGLDAGEFDVLTTLRRAGAPCKPSQLSELLMMSRAGMTSRLDRLERAGWIERQLDPADRRSLRITLTEAGRAVIDATLTEHAANLARLIAPLEASEVTALEDGLRRLILALAARGPDAD
jgi:DNA-binding MarR family transcriptional regulator